VQRRLRSPGRAAGARRTLLAALAAVALCAPWLGPATETVSASAGFGLLPGPSGCLVAPGKESKETERCGAGNALVGPNAIAISPDGAYVYVASGQRGATLQGSFGSVAILKRDPVSGAVTEIGCLSSDGTDGRDGAAGACTATPTLLGADGIAMSPDGKTLYVTSDMSGSVVAFARSIASGALTRIGCFQFRPPLGAPCPTANVYLSARAPVASADGKALYVASPEYGAVSAFLASPPAPAAGKSGSSGSSAGGGTQGSGSPASGPGSAEPETTVASLFGAPVASLENPCIAVNGLDGSCAVGVAMQNVGDLALGPDGHQLYASAPGSHAIDILTRGASGAITQSGCFKAEPPPGPCTDSTLKDAPSTLAVSPDGKNIYAIDSGSSGSGGRLDVLAIDPATGDLSDSSCVDYLPPPPAPPEKNEEETAEERHEREEEAKHPPAPPQGPCSHVAGLNNVDLIAVSGDGSAVYAFGEHGAVFFARDSATGKLTETSCAASEDSRCTSVPALGGRKEGVAVSPDGREVYFADPSSNAVFVYTLGASVATASAAATHAGSARLRVACPRALPSACVGRVQLARLVRRRERRGRAARRLERMLIGVSARFTINPGQRATVSVQLSSAGRRLLIARGRLRLAADVITSDWRSGGSGFGRRLTLSLGRY
jgi:sugar lactone lactonase YvrE